jgi:hypothetical protein
MNQVLVFSLNIKLCSIFNEDQGKCIKIIFLGGHQLLPGQGWMDEGGRGSLIWTAEQQTQYHRYQVGQKQNG